MWNDGVDSKGFSIEWTDFSMCSSICSSDFNVSNLFGSWKWMCSRIEDFGPGTDWVLLMEWVDTLMCSRIDLGFTVLTLFILLKLMCFWIEMGRIGFGSRTGRIENVSFSYSIADSLAILFRWAKCWRLSLSICCEDCMKFSKVFSVLVVCPHGCYWIQIVGVMDPWETNRIEN